MRHLHVPKYDELNLGDSVAVITWASSFLPLYKAHDKVFSRIVTLFENKENVPKSMEDFKSWILIIHPNSDERIKKNILVEGRCRRGWKEMFAFLLWNWEHVLGDHIFLMERGIGNAIRDLAVKMRHLRFVIYDVQRCPVEESRWPIPQFHFGNWFILWGWLETTLLDDPNIRPGMDDNASFDRG